MLVAPTEPAALRALGTTSLLPETMGVDYLTAAHGTYYGVQRKEFSDFVNSVYDGRLSKELAQMGALGGALLLIEGRARWSLEGEWMSGFGGGRRWTQAMHRSYLWSVQARGVWVDTTADANETADVIEHFCKWVAKERHDGTHARPPARGEWGKPSHREYVEHLVQGLPGVGVEMARRIVDAFGCPFAWRIEKAELLKVQGIGKKKADALWNALEMNE